MYIFEIFIQLFILFFYKNSYIDSLRMEVLFLGIATYL